MNKAAVWHVGLIGLGSIARDLCALLSQESRETVRITVLLRPGSHSLSALPPGVTAVTDVDDLLARRPDIVVEAAGQRAATEIVPHIMKTSIPVVLVSVGCLADSELLTMLTQEAETSGARLIIPAGAVGGLDYLGALRDDPGATVEYTSRKPLAAWSTEELAAAEISKNGERLLFQGPAKEAALRYPRNLNVAATIALAGIGMMRTKVRIVADPAISENMHEIVTQSRLGRAAFRFENTPSPANPKTSALTAHAVRHSLDRLRSHFSV